MPDILDIFILLVILFGIAFLIFIHEGGHFLAAKLSNVKVTDFFIGFGKKLFTFKRGETTYGIAVLPLGGYVKMSGESLLEENEKDDDPRSYINAPLYKKIFIVISGSLTNLIFAFLIMSVVFGFTGVLKDTNEIKKTKIGSPSDKILLPSDEIVAVNKVKSKRIDIITKEIKKHPNEIINIEVNRNNQIKNFKIKTLSMNAKGYIGIVVISRKGEKIRNMSFIESLKASGSFMYFVVSTTNGLLIKAITGQPALLVKNTSSIVGAVAIGIEISTSVLNYLSFIGLLSLVIGYFNLFPILPLDGGRILVDIVERIKGSPLPKNVLIAISAIGISLLFPLMIYLVVKDIIKLAFG